MSAAHRRSLRCAVILRSNSAKISPPSYPPPAAAPLASLRPRGEGPRVPCPVSHAGLCARKEVDLAGGGGGISVGSDGLPGRERGQGGYQPTPGRQFRARIPCSPPSTGEHRFRESQPRRVALHRECQLLRAARGLGETQPIGLRSLKGICAGEQAGRGGRQGPASARERRADANRRRRQPITRPASAPRHG